VTLVLNDEIYHDWAPAPDGQHIAYLTFDHRAKRRRVSVFSLETMRNEHVLDIIPETCLRWSADGRALFFTSTADGVANVWRAGLYGGKPEPVTPFVDERVFRFSVSPSGHLAIVRESVTYDAVMLTPDPK
jgi:Tol biopolymer transport system component